MLGENVVALCDVDENMVLQAAKKVPQAKQFRDFRKLYDNLKDSEFDAVVVSTTEHTHAAATLPALQRKKHVYCEKPLTRNVREARIITEAAKKAGVATQMGTQNHAQDNFRRVVELIQAGAVGPIREVHVWVSRAWGWQRNGTSLSVSHFVTDACDSKGDKPYRPAPPGLGIFRPLQRLRTASRQGKEVASDAELIANTEFTSKLVPFGWQSEEDAKKNKDRIWTVDRPKEEMAVPKGLDWDLWL